MTLFVNFVVIEDSMNWKINTTEGARAARNTLNWSTNTARDNGKKGVD